MLGRMYLSIAALSLLLATATKVESYDGGYYDHVARRAYYDGYGQGPYLRYGSGNDPEYGYGSYGFGYGPYGYGYGSYANGFSPRNSTYGTSSNGYGAVDYFGQPNGSAYSPYGTGIYSAY